MSEIDDIRKEILNIVTKRRPSTGNELIKILTDDLKLDRDDAINYLTSLEDEGKIIFLKSEDSPSGDLLGYLTSNYSHWFWITTFASLLGLFSIVLIPEGRFPLIYLRYVLGSLFTLFIPGFCITKILYPENNVSKLKIVTFSVGISLSIVAFLGLVLNYTPFGINLIPLASLNFVLILLFAILGVMREHGLRKEQFRVKDDN